MNDTKYFSRSWALLTRDKGWIKPMLVMAAATFVPIAGPLGNKGYALEYARLTAWGVDAAPKQKNVDVGKCIGSGFRGFVVDLGWGFVFGLAYVVAALISSLLPDMAGIVLAQMVSFALSVVSIFFYIVLHIAELRCAIYENIGAGYRPDRVLELIKRDTNGFMKVVLVSFVSSLIIGVITFVIIIFCLLIFMPFFFELVSGHVDEAALVRKLGMSMVWLFPICGVFGYAASLVGNILRVLILNCVGLWMRQFDVPRWGRSEDPLPEGTQPFGPNRQTHVPYAGPAQHPRQQQVQPNNDPNRPASSPQGNPAEAPQQRRQDAPRPKPASQPTKRVTPVETIPLVRVPKKDEPAQEASTVVGTEPVPAPEEEPHFTLNPEPMAEAAPSDDADKATFTLNPEPEVADADDRDDEPTVDDLYEGMLDAIRKNDHVPGDDDE